MRNDILSDIVWDVLLMLRTQTLFWKQSVMHH